MGIYPNLSTNENKITWDLKNVTNLLFCKGTLPLLSSLKHKPGPSDVNVISPEESEEAVVLGAAAVRAGAGTTITEKWTRYSRREQL